MEFVGYQFDFIIRGHRFETDDEACGDLPQVDKQKFVTNMCRECSHRFRTKEDGENLDTAQQVAYLELQDVYRASREGRNLPAHERLVELMLTFLYGEQVHGTERVGFDAQRISMIFPNPEDIMLFRLRLF